MSKNGVQAGLRLPERMLATSVARWPTVWPAASTTCHLRVCASPVPLGKYVDIDKSFYFKPLRRERLEYRSGPKIVKALLLFRIRARLSDPHLEGGRCTSRESSWAIQVWRFAFGLNFHFEFFYFSISSSVIVLRPQLPGRRSSVGRASDL